MDLRTWLKRKETFWPKTKEGDRNTKFFHVVASMRKRGNPHIIIFVDGNTLDEPSDIKRVAHDSFKNIFKEDQQVRSTLECLEF